MSKQLIVDFMPFQVRPEVIMESLQKNGGRLVVSGPIQRAEATNHNGRVYPLEVLQREVAKYQKLVKERRALGELDHPESSIINLSNASHLITELHWEGNDVMGTIEVLTTPSGNILRELFQCGVLVGISSRGLGSTKEIGEGVSEVGDDYEILGWDMVSNPSTQGSFVRPITESVDPMNKVSAKEAKINNIIREILSNLN